MSTFISEPGTRVGGRYRLEDRVGGSGGWLAWKAIDETLARPVAVLTFAPGFPRIGDVVTAARAASRLTDARLAQVFDVEDNWDQAYVVMEWVSNESLGDLLAEGPLDPGRSAEILAEGAEALASAHAAGLAHLCLTPESLRWSPVGGVKIAGVGIDAALAGVTADDPAEADTRGLGRLLYAALTGTWPGPDWPALPPAPEIDGQPRAPHQVRAGIPATLDEITCQALFQQGKRGAAPLATPAMLADALAAATPAPTPPPAAAVAGRRRGGDYRTAHQGGYGTDTAGGGSGYGEPVYASPGYDDPGYGDPSYGDPGYGDAGYWDAGPGQGGPPPPRGHRPAGGGRTRMIVAGVVVIILLAAVALVVRSLGGHGSPHPSALGNKPTHSASPSTAQAAVLKPVSAHGFDALSSPKDDPGNENDNMAALAIDGNPKTAWQTQYYFNNPVFGGLKTGTGLILDMGSPVRLSSVQVTFGTIPGADVRIEVGNSDQRSASALSSFTTVAQADNVSGTSTFQAHSTATGRYVLVWFTKLPPRKAGSQKQYQAEIFNIVVRGSH